MPIIIVIVLLSIVRHFEIGPFAHFSWWWIAGLFGVAFAWFEFVEPLLGLDKRRERRREDAARRERVRKTFKK